MIVATQLAQAHPVLGALGVVAFVLGVPGLMTAGAYLQVRAEERAGEDA